MKKWVVLLLSVILMFVTGCEASQTNSISSELKTKLSRDWSSIDLMYKYDLKVNGFAGQIYQLRTREDYCTFYYSNPSTKEEIHTNFTLEVYEELVDLVLKNEPVEYSIPADEHGKIEYGVVPHILKLYWGGQKGEQMLCSDPDNIDEIIAKFEEIKRYAIE